MSTNPELDLAYQFVSQTDRHVFLTGKAGTGKTTFLHRIRREVLKRMVVVAPTGVAAINAKGVTIHSQFQLPFGVLTPDRLQADLRTHRLSRQKADVLRSLDLLVIDEISMVRVDVLDAISAVLRKYRRSERPFGGVQLLMIGDLHQLPPVVRDNEWNQLRDDYQTAYFFGSKALAEAGVRTIQLQHIYRQSDADFIDLLNQVRNDRLDAASLQQLNSRYRGPEFQPPASEDYITLSSHNRTADQINARQLATLTTPLHTFAATISGKFPESMYPNEETLSFRVGAQVMFNKNDTAEKLYYNGKIGRITKIEGQEIEVSCPGEDPIPVLPVAWENRTYELDKVTKEVNDEVIGTFEQHPLRLAWAITIHKSQGLTFERVIIDAAAAFAHGQVYVALSRCKTFEGIVLRSRIGDSSVRTDRVVQDYSSRADDEAPTPDDLRSDQREFQLNCLRELFDFREADRQLGWLERVLFEHESAVQGDALAEARAIRSDLDQRVGKLGTGFLRQLTAYAKQDTLPADHPELSERLRNASAHFQEPLEAVCTRLAALPFMSDNRKVFDSITERLREAALTCFIKLRTFAVLGEGFHPDTYLRARADATIEFEQRAKSSSGKKTSSTAGASSHPILYQELAKWRTKTAEDQGIAAYRILHNAVLLRLADTLPRDAAAILQVEGFGEKSREAYGDELLVLIEKYCDADRVTVSTSGTKQQSLDAFRRGLTVAEVATQRGYTEGTIYNHLAHWVKTGELAVEELIAPDRLEVITSYLTDREIEGYKEVFEHFDKAYSYEEIRLAAASLPPNKKEATSCLPITPKNQMKTSSCTK
ncbi:ATP-dependent RecD-like DNA helicase [Neolewinella maritima]|uniref:ATP-dependent RecD-like DNA helicase n=1 Tax=Neolewinella maritima TaxID=1383882 RepID=A0ABM9B312_9BACT|nr:helix-turn-helix domain-containing protein [Neolewinella maritima]CAH1001732.1 ATP-dependent RecD-like DNA helicase [Neolewinella maritima]